MQSTITLGVKKFAAQLILLWVRGSRRAASAKRTFSMHSDQFWEGYHAYLEGISLRDNPYPNVDDAYEQDEWDAGWNQAQMDD